MDRLRRLELFIHAAEAGSFARAAWLLQLDPSTISHAVTDLEKELGLCLFHRTTRQLGLTDEGHAVLRRARSLLRDMAEIEQLGPQQHQRLEGTLRVGMSVSVSQHVMMPRMAEFLRQHPAMRVESLILNQSKDLHAAGLDVMFLSGKPKNSELVAHRVATLRLAVYAAPSYLARAGEPRHPQDLLNHICLIHKPAFSPRGWNDWEFKRGTQRLKIKAPMNLMTDDREGLLTVALQGGGIVRIGLLNPELLAMGRLTRALTDWECPGGPDIHVLYRKSSRGNPRVRAFLAFVDQVFAEFDPQGMSLWR